jgi:hypothetical protein
MPKRKKSKGVLDVLKVVGRVALPLLMNVLSGKKKRVVRRHKKVPRRITVRL